MKKCKFCEKNATMNYVVQTAKGKKKFPCCDEHEQSALEKIAIVKRGHVNKIPIFRSNNLKIENDYDLVNAISLLAGRIKEAADQFKTDNVTYTEEPIIVDADIDNADNWGNPIQIPHLDLQANLLGSQLADQIPAMITINQYAHKLNILLDAIEK